MQKQILLVNEALKDMVSLPKRMCHTIIKESFKDIDINNKFFNSFKKLYYDFENWFAKKQEEDSTAYIIYTEHDGILAFAHFKHEIEPIFLTDDCLPAEPRLKISSLKVDTRMVGKHFYHKFIEEYAFKMAVSLQYNKPPRNIPVYITLFDTCTELIEILESYGFKNVGTNTNHELVYIKS